MRSATTGAPSRPTSNAPDRDRRFWMGLHRWHLAMPWFEMIRLPAAYAGGELCWRGEMMWEGAASISPLAGRRLPHDRAGRRRPPHCRHRHQARHAGDAAHAAVDGAAACNIAVYALGARRRSWPLVLALVRLRARRTFLPFILIGLALLVIAIDDASFLGGVRPFDGGDDGLFYDGVGRVILQKLLAGDIWRLSRRRRKGLLLRRPGLRYFRALEHIVFGESYLGYLSLVLLLPFVVAKVFRRFLPRTLVARARLAVRRGAGRRLVRHQLRAIRQMGEPRLRRSGGLYFFIVALLPLVGFTPAGPGDRISAGVFRRAAARPRHLHEADRGARRRGPARRRRACRALSSGNGARLAGLCIGFLPVLVHGRCTTGSSATSFVLFSTNANDPHLLVMPPSAYARGGAANCCSLRFQRRSARVSYRSPIG